MQTPDSCQHEHLEEVLFDDGRGGDPEHTAQVWQCRDCGASFVEPRSQE